MYELLPAEQNEVKLFFRMDGEAAERHGAICGMQIDFERNADGALSYRFDCQRHLKSPAFKADLKRVLDYLRGRTEPPPLGNIDNFRAFCREHEGQTLTDGDINVSLAFGVKVQAEDFSYYLRCHPLIHSVNIFAYDNRYLLPELAGQHELPPRCVSILRSTLHDNCSKLVILRRGETGYCDHQLKAGTPEQARQKADELNGLMGVTRAQEEAMYTGSMWGWTVPGAKPWNYDMDGKPRPLTPKKDRPER
jgi:hypothetical protein